MRLRLIRNATMLGDDSGQHILTDPLFADRFALPSYSGRARNPVADLPLPVDDILAGVEWFCSRTGMATTSTPQRASASPKLFRSIASQPTPPHLSPAGFSM